MSKHTFGPWTCTRSMLVYGQGGELKPAVAAVLEHCVSGDEARANAALIAAAPEMFDELARLVVAIERAAEMIEEIDLTAYVGLSETIAVIRKARGEG